MNSTVGVNAQVSITNIIYTMPGVSVFFTTQKRMVMIVF